jgi:hypothetical protein
MIYYAVLFTAFFLFGFVIRNFRKVFHTLAENSLALVNELISAEEEDTKLSQVEKSTHKLVISMGSMFGVLILSFILTAVPFVMYILFTGIEFRNLDFSSFTAILVLSLGATLPFIIPGRKKRKTEYSELSQLLHRLALDNYNLAFKLFKWERRRRKKKGVSTRKDFVIVSGLARAGTTSLMNKLAEMDGFVSLSYANMPFLLCPNTWSRFYRPKSGKLKERSHKDGIMIGLNSNEALEEYFFKVKARDGYILPNALTGYHLPEQDYLDYLDYQSLVKRDPEKI